MGAHAAAGLLRCALGAVRDRVSAALRGAGFALDLADVHNARSRNGNRYSIWRLP